MQSRPPTRDRPPQFHLTPATPTATRLLDLVARIRKIDDEAIETRREKRSALRRPQGSNAEEVKACEGCRRAKTKCFNVDGAACTRCQVAGRVCTYPEAKVRGRKADRTIQSLLNCMEDELAALLAPDPRSRQQPSGTSRAQRAEDSASHSALHNPLGVLATAATQPSGLLMHGGQSGLYWNNIYSVKPEEDLGQDPVLQGILEEEDLNRLVELYFAKLAPTFMHLDDGVHSPIFLRMNSPFLTTAIAAVAASFDPLSLLIAPGLQAHAHRLASLAFENGSKSLEVVQGFLALVHWAAWPSHDWLADRSWAYQGQAMRLACEIRLDLPPDPNLALTYRHSRPLTDDEVARLMACRKRTYLLVCLSEIGLATQSGRADTTSGHRLIHPPDLGFLRPHDSRNMTFSASVKLNHIFGRALHRWHGMDKDDTPDLERELFVRDWRRDLGEWKTSWMGTSRLVDVAAVYNHIMLLLLSLRVPGSHASTQALLREISELAVQLLVTVLRWRDDVPFDESGGLAYASNFLIVQIAYGAALVHKLARPLDSDRAAEVSARVTDIATLLDQIAAARLHTVSFAGYYAAQIRSLCGLEAPPQPSHHVNINVQGAAGPDPFDFSFMLDHEPHAFDATVISDRILSLLGVGLEEQWE
ncbi:Protein priB [Vanrija pseudolonga]|uniref:Protein priB n=1 Tax=Vanrija pseudolonga TaxID=143232 RepID=A0AAF1BN18_9TREE|nr:Protein priB [Vanrija pseudolonga]